LRKAKAHHPDVVIVDVQMPPDGTDNGLRAAVELRELQAQHRIELRAQLQPPQTRAAVRSNRSQRLRRTISSPFPHSFGNAGRRGAELAPRLAAGERLVSTALLTRANINAATDRPDTSPSDQPAEQAGGDDPS
jgi:DNA-binding NarL/FixJ family response regulator